MLKYFSYSFYIPVVAVILLPTGVRLIVNNYIFLSVFAAWEIIFWQPDQYLLNAVILRLTARSTYFNSTFNLIQLEKELS